jgi:hypothetical protein
MKSLSRLFAIALPTLLVATFALAEPDKQVVYRLVDKKGKTTYADKAPGKEFEGKVTRIEVDLKANRAMLKPVGESTPPVTLPLTAPELKRVKADAELARANEILEAAKKALEDGKEPKEDETQFVGKVGGGARPVQTEAYNARIKKLEDAVKSAEAEVDRARTAARQASID